MSSSESVESTFIIQFVEVATCAITYGNFVRWSSCTIKLLLYLGDNALTYG